MLGGGAIVNLPVLARGLGFFGGFLYLVGFAILSPVILAIGNLAINNPVQGGVFYQTQKNLGNFLAFLTTWTYFLGRSASISVLSLAASKIILSYFPLHFANFAFILATGIIFILGFLNLAGISLTGTIQYFFVVFKIFPIIVLSLLSFFYLDFSNLPQLASLDFLIAQDAVTTLPSALYALLGFTVIMHIGHMIEKPEKSGTVLLLATASAAIICFVFQTSAFLTSGDSLFGLNPIAKFVEKITVLPFFLKLIFKKLALAAVLSSAFSFISSNVWNLQVMLKENFKQKIKEEYLLKIAMLVQACLASFFILNLKKISTLQATTVLATILAYLSCCFAFLILNKKNNLNFFIGILSILSCFLISAISCINVVQQGASTEFLATFLIGFLFVIATQVFKSV